MKKTFKIVLLICVFVCVLALTACSGFSGESKGLFFELNADKASYSVIGIGVCTDKYITIPNMYNGLPVTKIADYAFCNTDIKGVKISENVVSIGEAAFADCGSLKKLKFSNSGKLKSIGDYAFYWPSFWLWNVDIPEGVESIGDHAFDLAWPINLSLPNSLEDVGIGAFVGMKGANGSHEAYFFDFLCPYENYGGGVYLGNDSNPYLLLCSLPNTYAVRCQIPTSTKIIGAGAFYNCVNLNSISIPESVQIIGDAAFLECYSLESIVIPKSVTKIGNDVFADCHSLKIYCMVNNKLTGWSDKWNSSNCPVTWGYNYQ